MAAGSTERVQNIHRLKIMNIPYAMCILFENAVSQVRSITYSQNIRQGGAPVHDSIYGCIFEFSGIYYQNTHGNGGDFTIASHQDIVSCTRFNARATRGR
jgi:hypothetical protein